MQYKQFADQPERQAAMRRTWMQRLAQSHRQILVYADTFDNSLQGCQPDVETWQAVLKVRTLVVWPEDDNTMWIKFANLCRKSERMILADKTINSLLYRVRHVFIFVKGLKLMHNRLRNTLDKKGLHLTLFMPNSSLCGRTTATKMH